MELMMNEKDEALIDGFRFSQGGKMYAVGIKTSDKRIEFNAEDGFGSLLTNPLKTDNGLTVGERNRAALHRRLDAWLDGTWREDKDE
jgi:hypothetical protein